MTDKICEIEQERALKKKLKETERDSQESDPRSNKPMFGN